MEQHETIEQYLERNPEQAVTMNFSVPKNCLRQILPYTECHRAGCSLERFNVAVLLLYVKLL